jgi:hypothetical protein
MPHTHNDSMSVKPMVEVKPGENVLISLNGRLHAVMSYTALMDDRYQIRVRSWSGGVVSLFITNETLVVSVDRETFVLFMEVGR